MLTDTQIQQIRDEVERLYPYPLNKAVTKVIIADTQRDAYIAGVTAERERGDFTTLFTDTLSISKTIFPDAGPVDHLIKLKEETDEVIADPADLTEYADCLITLVAAAGKAGFSAGELITRAREKLQILPTRQWTKDANNVYQHVK